MSKSDDIQSALTSLVARGAKLLEDGQAESLQLVDLALGYESWYTEALSAIRQLIPERVPDFTAAYRSERVRKDITAATYTIADFLMGISISSFGQPAFNTKSAFSTNLLRQVGIVKAASAAARSVLRDIRTTLRAEILDSDISASRELVKAGHLRSAGVVCGVALEAHLGSVAERRAVAMKKKDPSIGDFNDALKSASAYDVPTWRFIQRLADIRNLCAHKKDRDPTPSEVGDLIDGTDKILKEVF